MPNSEVYQVTNSLGKTSNYNSTQTNTSQKRIFQISNYQKAKRLYQSGQKITHFPKIEADFQKQLLKATHLTPILPTTINSH